MPLKVARYNWFAKHVIMRNPSTGIKDGPAKEASNAIREAIDIVLHLSNICKFAFYCTSRWIANQAGCTSYLAWL